MKYEREEGREMEGGGMEKEKKRAGRRGVGERGKIEGKYENEEMNDEEGWE